MLAGAIVSCVWANENTVDSKVLPTLYDIATMPKSSRKKKTCFLGYYKSASVIQYGIPRFFFRFTFTNAFHGVAMGYLRNINAKPHHSSPRAINIYQMSDNEFKTGPAMATARHQQCPYVEIGDLLPTRFVMAGDTANRITFIPLDYQLLADESSSQYYTDLSDDVIGYSSNEESYGNISDSIWKFMNSKIVDFVDVL